MRYLAALVLTLVVNLALFWLMQHILLTEQALPEPPPITQLSFVDLSILPLQPEAPTNATAPIAPSLPAPAQPTPPAPAADLPDLALPQLEQPTISLPPPQIGQAAAPEKPKAEPKPKPQPSKPTQTPATKPVNKAAAEAATTSASTGNQTKTASTTASSNSASTHSSATPAAPPLKNGRVLADQDLQPIVRSEPRYPRLAKQSQQEGKVVVEFVIGKDGKVYEPKIIYAQPPGVFENASLQAISRWRYKPRIIQGQAVEQLAQQTLVFRLR